ncbi:MAG: shikimate kinase [Candidatus Omnitrophota bacterium]|nr:shikimate kinase [Candidatus Omnitrophota bacterium]
MPDNIYLIGMMGAGKTVAGKQMAKHLKRPFVDVDSAIEQSEGMKIREIFKKKGEKYFRDVESRVLEEIASGECQVVGTGGGIVRSEKNIACMKSTGKVVYLEASSEVLWKRVHGDRDRPLVQSESDFEELLAERKPAYERASAVTVNSEQSLSQMLEDIKKGLAGTA